LPILKKTFGVKLLPSYIKIKISRYPDLNVSQKFKIKSNMMLHKLSMEPIVLLLLVIHASMGGPRNQSWHIFALSNMEIIEIKVGVGYARDYERQH
jgi:hypothetical protein